jgi:acyl carrier protein
VSRIEAEYAISVPPADFTPVRFRTLDAIAAYVLEARGAA